MLLKFNCNVKVVDMIMGAGKTSAAINYINQAKSDEKFLFITPYIKEIERITKSCPTKNFKEPLKMGSKLNGIKYLLSKGENIISTHALFRRFDSEAIDLCRNQNYTLIMDEVTDVIEKYEISKEDFKILQDNFVDYDESSGLLKWRNPDDNYEGKFSEEKRLCELGCLAYYSDSVMMWLLPIESFNAFKDVYILTYMFNSQIQRYYYDYYNLPYTFLYVGGTSQANYHFTTNCKEKEQIDYDFKSLIHILEDEKMNLIGDMEFDLSKNWYIRNQNNIVIKKLKNNIENFFRNKRKTKTEFNMWTTFSDFKKKLSSKGYGRGFVALNMRASNNYKHKTSIAYPVNRYMNTGIKNFFVSHNVDVDEDGFAVSEMLQFIWRSAIREGNEIWIYIPSLRMRGLLSKWIEENTVSFKKQT
nr:MAG TPA: Cas system-associated protein [Caudoviricetes sp.]